MNTRIELWSRPLVAALIAVWVALAASAAAAAQEDLLPDPLEPVNRVSHVFNKQLDRFFLRPASEFWEENVPEPAKVSILSFNSTWGLPVRGINSALQGKPEEAANSFARFGLNATLGFLGFIDLASEAGIPANDSGFSETMAVWGVGEGIYIELPGLGPGSSRDMVGRVVDLFVNPFSALNPTPGYVQTSATVLDVMDTRSSFGPTIDNVYYESADSYNALKLITIQQSRRSAAGGVATEDDFIDIYAE